MADEKAQSEKRRNVVEAALKAVHADLISALEGEFIDWRPGTEMRAALRQHLGGTRGESDFLETWLEIISKAGNDQTRERIRAVGAHQEKLRTIWRGGVLRSDGDLAKDSSIALFDLLLGVALMPLDTADDEFFYAGIYHKLIPTAQSSVVMDTVFVPSKSGSVGHTNKHPGKHSIRTISNTIRELRGHVSIEDLIGGNLSLVTACLKNAEDKVFGILFFFFPIPDFFPSTTWAAPEAAEYASNFERLCRRIADSHQIGLSAVLRTNAKDAALTRVTNLYRSSQFEVERIRGEGLVEAHQGLLLALLPEAHGGDAFGAAVGLSMVRIRAGYRLTGLMVSQRFLETHMSSRALHNCVFHDKVNAKLELFAHGMRQSPKTKARTATAPRLLAQWPIVVRKSEHAASLSAVDLSIYDMVLVHGTAEPPKSSCLLLHVQRKADDLTGNPPPAFVRIDGLDTLLAPCDWLEAAWKKQKVSVVDEIKKLFENGYQGDPNDSLAFARAIEALKLLSDASDSYLRIVTEVLSGQHILRDTLEVLASYLDGLFNLLEVRINPTRRKSDGSWFRTRPAEIPGRESLLDALKKLADTTEATFVQLGTVVGISAYRNASDWPICTSVTPGPGVAEVDKLADTILNKLKGQGEMDRLGRLTLLLSLVDDAGVKYPRVSMSEANEPRDFPELLLRGLGYDGDIAAACGSRSDHLYANADYFLDGVTRGEIGSCRLVAGKDDTASELKLTWHMGEVFRLVHFSARSKTIRTVINRQLTTAYDSPADHLELADPNEILRTVEGRPDTDLHATVADVLSGTNPVGEFAATREDPNQLPSELFLFRSAHAFSEEVTSVLTAVEGFRGSLVAAQSANKRAEMAAARRDACNAICMLSLSERADIRAHQPWTVAKVQSDSRLLRAVEAVTGKKVTECGEEELTRVVHQLATTDNGVQVLSRWFKLASFIWPTGETNREFGIAVVRGSSAMDGITHDPDPPAPEMSSTERAGLAKLAGDEFPLIQQILANDEQALNQLTRYFGDVSTNPHQSLREAGDTLTGPWKFSIASIWRALSPLAGGSLKKMRCDPILAVELALDGTPSVLVGSRIVGKTMYSAPLPQNCWTTGKGETHPMNQRIPFALTNILSSVAGRAKDGQYIVALTLEDWNAQPGSRTQAYVFPSLRVMFASKLKNQVQPFRSQGDLAPAKDGHSLGVALQLLAGYGAWTTFEKTDAAGWLPRVTFLEGSEPIRLHPYEVGLVEDGPYNQLFVVRIGLPRW
jgi:hypothetical protein